MFCRDARSRVSILNSLSERGFRMNPNGIKNTGTKTLIPEMLNISCV